ncbi:MAG: NUDIX domain-containing protein [Gammaproteobacteria bacterium]|nr:NUDIX domain-containing protein [Gammaproteobacteria bacterium]
MVSVNQTLTQPAGRDAPMYVSTEIVIFTIREARLQVVLRRRRRDPLKGGGTWALPGGAVGVDEDVDLAATRTLTQQTGLKDVYLEQLYTFGCPDRHPERRLITVAYYALAPVERTVDAQRHKDELVWFPCGALPELYLDHGAIIDVARGRLKAKLDYSTIAFQFMPKRFTLSELQHVYETILGETLDKRNFRKRVLSIGTLEQTGNMRRDGCHRPARLYRLKTPGKVQFIK